MTILRINKKERNFLIVDKTCLNQKDLSWGAKGLHAHLMGMPDNAQVKVSRLKDKATNGRDAVRSFLNELKKAGYITTEWIRKEASGEYDYLEYIVHELPQPSIGEIQDTETPSPETPSPDYSRPDNPSHINNILNNNNINNINNKIIAAIKASNRQDLSFKPQKAAALFQKNKTTSTNLSNSHFGRQPYVRLAAEDLVIGDTLTPNQLIRIDSLVQSLNLQDGQNLIDEISYCLLSRKYFTGCGLDFNRKLNAIRKVVLQGNWQTPAGMILDIKEKQGLSHKKLKDELQQALAESNHFKRLLESSKTSTREHFETIIQKTQNKIIELEKQLHQSSADLREEIFNAKQNNRTYYSLNSQVPIAV